MKNLKLFYVIVLFFAILSSQLFSQQQLSVFKPGEELVYEVSFLGIGLGTIKIISKGEVELNGKKVNNAYCEMKSYSGIPFVELHAFFDSWFDKSLTFSYQFIGNNKADANNWDYQKIITDYPNKKVYIEEWKYKEQTMNKWVDFDKKLNDGCSLFFFARQFTDYGKSIKVPTVINNQLESTTLNFSKKREMVEIDAIKYPVKTIYFDGKAEWEAIYGLTGKFKGWFSDDEARVPIKAEMNVYVGSVKIELIKWTREGWTPPRADLK